MYFYFTLSYLLLFLFFWSEFSSLFLVPKIIFFLVLNLVWLGFTVFKTKEIEIDKTYWHITIVSAAMCLVSLIFADNFWLNFHGDHNSFAGIAITINLVVFFLLARIYFLQDKDSKVFLNVFFPIALLICIIGILQNFGLNFIEINDNLFAGRIYSTLGNPSSLGFIAAIATLLSIQSKNKYRFLAPIFLATLMLTESRSAILALAASICNIGILSKNLKIRLGTITAVVLSIIIWLLVFELTSIRSLFSRFYIWESTIEFLYSNPLKLLIGSDLTAFHNNVTPYLNSNYYKYEPLVRNLNSAHNIILATIYNYGIIAFSFICFYLYKVGRKIKNTSTFAVIILILVFALLNNFFLESAIICIFILTGLELNNNKYIKITAVKYLILPLILINIYQIYYITQFEKKVENVYENMLSPKELQLSLQNLQIFAPFSDTTQNFILVFDEFPPLEDKYLSKNIEFKISKMSKTELEKYFLEVQSKKRFVPIELVAFYKKAHEIQHLTLEIQEYFIKNYPYQIKKNTPLYKENEFVFKGLNLIR